MPSGGASGAPPRPQALLGTPRLCGTQFENYEFCSSSFRSEGPQTCRQAHPESQARKWREVPATNPRPWPYASEADVFLLTLNLSPHQSDSPNSWDGVTVPLPRPFLKGKSSRAPRLPAPGSDPPRAPTVCQRLQSPRCLVLGGPPRAVATELAPPGCCSPSSLWSCGRWVCRPALVPRCPVEAL